MLRPAPQALSAPALKEATVIVSGSCQPYQYMKCEKAVKFYVNLFLTSIECRFNEKERKAIAVIIIIFFLI